MKEINEVVERIVGRLNIHLRKINLNVDVYIRDLLSHDQLAQYYALYCISVHDSFGIECNRSSISGSYIQGRCVIDDSILYKTDVRGDELKNRGEVLHYKDLASPLFGDERIVIRNSFLHRTLIHNYSHVPEHPERFYILNTVSMDHANIHGSPMEGVFLDAFSTVDLTCCKASTVGAYAYVQTGELTDTRIEPGRIFLTDTDRFTFDYTHDAEILGRYVRVKPGAKPQGILVDLMESFKERFEPSFDAVGSCLAGSIPPGACVNPYSVLHGETHIGKNVLVAQRAYLEDSWLGKGANAQENCCIIHSHLDGFNVTAHGGKILYAHLDEKVFVGFNSFLRGLPDQPLRIGEGSIVMPHTIIDLQEPVAIPEDHLVWGYISNSRDLETHGISLSQLSDVEGTLEIGRMRFTGNGAAFTSAFRERIEHILDANGAYFDGVRNAGHAQKSRLACFYILQPYPYGPKEGLFPSIDIRS